MKQVQLTTRERATLNVRDAVDDSALAEKLYALGGQWGSSHQAVKIVSSAKDASTLDIEGQFEGKSVVRFVPLSPPLRHQVGVVEFEVIVAESASASDDARTLQNSQPTPDDDEKVSGAARRLRKRKKGAKKRA